MSLALASQGQRVIVCYILLLFDPGLGFYSYLQCHLLISSDLMTCCRSAENRLAYERLIGCVITKGEMSNYLALIEIVIHYFGTYRTARLYNKYFIITLIFPRCTSVAYVFATIWTFHSIVIFVAQGANMVIDAPTVFESTFSINTSIYIFDVVSVIRPRLILAFYNNAFCHCMKMGAYTI